MQVLTRLRACPAQEIGVGLAHRLAAEEQRSFLIESGSAGGRRQGQGRRGQIERGTLPRDPCRADFCPRAAAAVSRSGGIAHRQSPARDLKVQARSVECESC